MKLLRFFSIVSTALFAVLALTQLAMIFRITPAVVSRLMWHGHRFYLPMAALGWVVVVAGVLAERYRPNEGAGRAARGVGVLLAPWLDRLTGRRTAAPPAPVDAAWLEATLRETVIGQDEVCIAVARTLQLRGLSASGSRPRAIFLMVGPAGSGKTLLCKQLAILLKRTLIHLDMSRFSELMATTELFGSPPGYVGSDRMGSLTRRIADAPDAVVLLDEIEKAHPAVLNKFLVAWNDGVMTDMATGRAVSCRGAIFAMTSNAAAEALARLAARPAAPGGSGARPHLQLVGSAASEGPAPEAGLRHEAVRVLRQHGFAPELLDRVDQVLVFTRLRDHAQSRLACAEARAMLNTLGYVLEPPEPALFDDVLARYRAGGAMLSGRDIIRMVEGLLAPQVATLGAAGQRVRLRSSASGPVLEPAQA